MRKADRAALERLAQAHDLQLSYRDLDRNDVVASDDALIAALRGMGVIESVGDVRDALKQHELTAWQWSIPPVIVAWGDGDAALDQRARAAPVPLRIPAQALDTTALVRIELEDGNVIERTMQLEARKVTAEATVQRERFLQINLRLPPGLPFGYHRLAVEAGGEVMRSLVIAAPRHAYAPEHGPAWGVFLPLYALHSRRSWGIGDYTDLKHLIEWAGGKGASVVATLPLLPAFLDRPFTPSPYEPVSRLFWNEVFIDPEAAPFSCLDGRGDAEVLPVNAGLAERARALSSAPDVDYAAVMALKREALAAQARSLAPGGPEARAMEAYLDSRPDVRDYAAFRAAVERLGPDWRAWPARHRRGRLQPADYDQETAGYYEYAQWLAHCQMGATAETARELGMRSYLDLPVGVHQQGYDAWRYQDVFAQGLTVGAPPDLLSSNGQNWGFQPLVPERLRQSGCEYMVRYLRHYFDSAKMLRIDHAIGLHRLYWIPEGATGRDGVFVRQPAEELYAVLCLESVRNQGVVIAEDLGLVPPEVRRGLKSHGISGMYVQMFETTGRKTKPLRSPPERSVASFGTHDLPSFAAYWRDDDLESRESLGLLTPERVAEEKTGRTRARRALVVHLKERGLVGDESDVDQVFRAGTALLAESDAEWVLLNLEDAWGETRAHNMPGTTREQHSNWVSRAAHGLDDFDAIESLSKALETVRLYRRTPTRPPRERDRERPAATEAQSGVRP